MAPVSIPQFEQFIPQIEKALQEKAADGVVDMQEIRRVVRRTVGRWVSDTYRRRPMIIPVVVEV